MGNTSQRPLYDVIVHTKHIIMGTTGSTIVYIIDQSTSAKVEDTWRGVRFTIKMNHDEVIKILFPSHDKSKLLAMECDINDIASHQSFEQVQHSSDAAAASTAAVPSLRFKVDYSRCEIRVDDFEAAEEAAAAAEEAVAVAVAASVAAAAAAHQKGI
jgi:hypothetical protein